MKDQRDLMPLSREAKVDKEVNVEEEDSEVKEVETEAEAGEEEVAEAARTGETQAKTLMASQLLARKTRLTTEEEAEVEEVIEEEETEASLEEEMRLAQEEEVSTEEEERDQELLATKLLSKQPLQLKPRSEDDNHNEQLISCYELCL